MKHEHTTPSPWVKPAAVCLEHAPWSGIYRRYQGVEEGPQKLVP